MPRPARIHRDQIIQAAVALADEAGIEGVTMRALASRLEVEAMALYRHVDGKEGLLDAMVESVVAEVRFSITDGPWREALRARCHGLRDMLRRHPWAAALLVSRVNVGPEMLRIVDGTIRILRRAGFTIADVDHAWHALDSHVYGFTMQEQNFPFREEEHASAARDYLPRIPAEALPGLHEMTRAVADGEHAGVQDFDFGLEILLDGLERRLRADRDP